jgi:putative flippase GtrA
MVLGGLNTFNHTSVTSTKAGEYLQVALSMLQRHKKLLCYMGVGGLTTVLSILLLHLFVRRLELAPMLAYIPQSAITITVGFLLHSQFTCREEQLSWRTNFGRWIVVRIFQLAAGFVLFTLLLHLPLVRLPYQVANQLNGAMLMWPVYKLSTNWALAGEGEVKGVSFGRGNTPKLRRDL